MTNKEKFLAKMPFSITGRYDSNWVKIGVYRLSGEDTLVEHYTKSETKFHGTVTPGNLSIDVQGFILDKKFAVKLKYSLMVFDEKLLRY